jgi:hypothetical protein
VGEVSGIDCAHPLSDAEVAAITAGMDEYGVSVFHDQPLTDEQQLRFILQFGTMEPGFGNIRGVGALGKSRDGRMLLGVGALGQSRDGRMLLPLWFECPDAT